MRGFLLVRGGTAFACALVIAGCSEGERHAASSARPAHVEVHASPSPSLVDQPVRLSISGLPANATASLRATWRSWNGVPWRSAQRIRADATGRVRLSGLDGMRFIWSMTTRNQQRQFFGVGIDRPSRIQIEVRMHGRALGQTTLTKMAAAPAVHRRDLRVAKNGLYGTYFAPPSSYPRRPALVMLSGSGGGAPYDMAAVLASHGYPTLALNYFAAPGLPPRLNRIPLEYFARAFRYLARQPGVDPRRLVVEGTSLGGEAAMVIGSTFPRLVHGVIGLVPGYQMGYGAGGGPAWTLRGSPLDPLRAIPVERIAGPILMAGSGEDAAWTSSANTDQIHQRLRDHRFRYRVTRLDFPKAGHDLDLPYKPQADPLTFGGDRRATAQAQVVLWKRMLQFLRRL